MKEQLSLLIAKSEDPFVAYGRLFTPEEAIGAMFNNPFDRGWNFGAGDPEFWKYKDVMLVPGGKVLDLGMSNGRTAKFFALNGMNVVGYENSPHPISFMRELLDRYELPIEVRDGDMHEAELGVDEYDTVILGQALTHVASKSHAYRLLDKGISAVKPGGHLWIRTSGTLDADYKLFNNYVEMGHSGVNKVAEDVFALLCDCSGQTKVEPLLFLHPLELAAYVAQEMTFIHTQLLPGETAWNIMFGEDYNPGSLPRLPTGLISILARKN